MMVGFEIKKKKLFSLAAGVVYSFDRYTEIAYQLFHVPDHLFPCVIISNLRRAVLVLCLGRVGSLGYFHSRNGYFGMGGLATNINPLIVALVSP